MARLGRSEQVLYEERHWVPWWLLALAFAVPFALLAGLSVVVQAGSDSDALSPLVGALVGAGFGLFFAGFFWANHAQRVIRVTDRAAFGSSVQRDADRIVSALNRAAQVRR